MDKIPLENKGLTLSILKKNECIGILFLPIGQKLDC